MLFCLSILHLFLSAPKSSLGNPIRYHSITTYNSIADYLNQKNIDADDKLLSINNYTHTVNYYNKNITQSFQIKLSETIKNQQLEDENKKKEQKMTNFTRENHYEQRISFLYVSVSLLLIIIILIFYKWQNTKRNFIATKLKLTSLEKEEIKLNQSLEQKHIIHKEPHKYEALLETYFKEKEVKEKEKELNKLKKEKELLNKKIDEYRKKLHQYENNLPQYDKLNIEPFDILIKDLSSLILKRCGEKSEEYLNRLQEVNESFIFYLEEISKGSIFTLYLKYCICFAIGMKTKEISECFSVEPGTIHVTRSRIKKKLGLGSKDKLDVYLKRLIQE